MSLHSEPLLASLAQAYLDGKSQLSQLLECAEQTRQSLEEHTLQMQTRLEHEAPHVLALIQPELQSWRMSCGEFSQWINVVTQSQGEAEPLVSLCSGLPITSQRLQFDGFRLDHAIWVSRGPTTMAPINRLLTAADQGLELEPLCQMETQVLSNSLDAFIQSYPEELHPHILPCLESILEWLNSPPHSDDVQEWQAEGERLGREFSQFDLAFILRSYSSAPTLYPPLNLALNACWLQPQGFVAPQLTQYLLEDAITQVEALPPPEEGELPEIFQDMTSLLAQLLKNCQRGQDLSSLHQVASEVAQEFQAALTDLSQEDIIKCSICQHDQPIGSKRCSLCGSELKAMDSTTGTPATPDRLEQMLTIAQRLLMRDPVSASNLEKELQSYRQDMRTARKYKEATYSSILDQFEQGLDSLEEYLNLPDQDLLNQASSNLRQAESQLKQWQESQSAH